MKTKTNKVKVRRIGRKKKALPPHTWEAHPTANQGEVNKTMIIAIIAILAIVALAVLLFFSDTFVGEAIFAGQENTIGFVVTPEIVVVGEPFTVTVKANIGGKQTVAVNVSTVHDHALGDYNPINLLYWSEDNGAVIMDFSPGFGDGLSEHQVGLASATLNISSAKTETFDIFKILFSGVSQPGTYNLAFDNIKIIDLNTGGPIPIIGINHSLVATLCGNSIVDGGEDFSTCPADVICAEGLICQDGACNPVPVCVDSDVTELFPDGKNYFTQGTVLDAIDGCRLFDGNAYNLIDSCFGENCFLEEYYCIGNDLYSTYYSECALGCENGACVAPITCIDPDNTYPIPSEEAGWLTYDINSFKTKTTVNLSNGENGTDHCGLDGDSVIEYYCENNSIIAYNGYVCNDKFPGTTCELGACVSTLESCVPGDVGCSEDGAKKWKCQPGEDGLLYKNYQVCTDEIGGTTCQDGICVAKPLICTDSDLDSYCAETNDCNDTNSSLWVSMSGYLDLDNDGYGNGVVTSFCTNGTLPNLVANNNNDCNDNNGSVTVCGAGEDCVNNTCIIPEVASLEGTNCTIDAECGAFYCAESICTNVTGKVILSNGDGDNIGGNYITNIRAVEGFSVDVTVYTVLYGNNSKKLVLKSQLIEGGLTAGGIYPAIVDYIGNVVSKHVIVYDNAPSQNPIVYGTLEVNYE